ncbi:MAG: nucleotidyltransferase family protein [Ginsengibacter sp.]
MSKYAIILLAAGSSSRFGSPKQLAQNNGRSFVAHAIIEALKVTKEVIVVLGANHEVIKKEIEKFPIHIVWNEKWEEGMSSSIKKGMEILLQHETFPDAIIIAVCDQPFLSSGIMNSLIEKYESGDRPIIASAYNNVLGTPTLFNQSFFSALMELKGQAGAKKIISENKAVVDTVSFPLGYVDIDTIEDFEQWKTYTKID